MAKALKMEIGFDQHIFYIMALLEELKARRKARTAARTLLLLPKLEQDLFILFI